MCDRRDVQKKKNSNTVEEDIRYPDSSEISFKLFCEVKHN